MWVWLRNLERGTQSTSRLESGTHGNHYAAVNSAEFVTIAKMAASVDTLDGFLREMKTRFPDATARAPLPADMAKGEPVHTGSLPAIIGLKRVDAAK